MLLRLQATATPMRSNRTGVGIGSVLSPSRINCLTPPVDNASNVVLPNESIKARAASQAKSLEKIPNTPISSGYKRRRLSDEENLGGKETSPARAKLLSKFELQVDSKKHRRGDEDTDTDDSDDDEEYDIENEHNYQCASILQRVQRSNSMDKSMLGTNEELISSIRGRLYEWLPYDIATKYYGIPESDKKGSLWVRLGTGLVKFTKDLEEGIMHGTIGMAMMDEGNLKKLFSHRIEPASKAEPLGNNSKGYTWKAVNEHTERTLALKFASMEEAMKWKDVFERSKRDTLAARMANVGADASDTSAGDEMAECMKLLSTGPAVLSGESPLKKKATFKKRRV